MERLSLQDRVSTNIRILLERRGGPSRHLASLVGMDHEGLLHRLDGTTAWDVVDIERVADALGVPWQSLLLHDEHELLRQAEQQ